MDFSWVKQLADNSNRVEQERREKKRRDTEQERQLALATSPFIDKLYLVLSTCVEEFNKHMNFSPGKVAVTRVQKRVKRTVNESDPELSYSEESTFFAFSRKDWTYGIRGCAGHVEFIEMPTTGGPLTVRLDEIGATPSRKLVGYLDEEAQQIGWKQDDRVVDGQGIMSICKDYFREFIERTDQ